MAMATEPLISLTRVSKEYASGDAVVRALREIDLTIAPGEFVAIVGTSGSGKSTLMNVLGCLDRPTVGTYELAGIDAGGRTNDARALVRNRLIGFIFQGFNLLPRTTALENVELPLQYRGIKAVERRARALSALASVGLADRVHHTPNQLSGGQQQRVAIARALVTDPPLLLADEPTGNLDTRTSLEVLALLQSLNRERGITICIVTHEHDIAACARRIITFRDGRIVSDAPSPNPLDAAAALAALPPAEVYSRDADAAEDPAMAARKQLGGPVPFAVHAMAMLGIVVGALCGLAYNAIVLGIAPLATAWPSVAFALVLDTLFAALYARKRLGRPLTPDQRARLALHLTLGLLGVSAVVSLVMMKIRAPASSVAFFDALAARGSVVAIFGVAVAMLVVALVHYLFFALFSPRK
jgi:putative ABC transport system ATP-binding protein